MKKLLLTTFTICLWLLMATGTGLAQQASGSLECCASQPICAGETASLIVALEGKAPYTFRYSDGTNNYTVSTSDKSYTLKVAPANTRSYSLLSMQDAKGSGQACGSATVAVNQCKPAGSGKDCSENCFDSKILEQKTTGNCTTYTLLVSNDGSCQSALSHYSISVPCGKVTEASNSKGWAMEIGTTDPSTGITGIKVDNIKGFGENGKAGSFTVTYTICADSCGKTDPYCGFLVGYKAGTCVNYGTAEPPYKPMSGILAATNIKCFGQNTGSIQLTLTGGKAPYTYSWSNGASTENISNVAAGTYTLTITDATSKSLALSSTLHQPQALQLQANTTQTSCGGSTGSVDLSVSGGTAPYTYAWNTGATTQDLSSLAAGTYSVTVSDANSCTVTGSYTIGDTSTMMLSLSGGSNGCTTSAITASLSGGTAPYSYRWNTGETTSSISPTVAGNYTLTVTDATGCTATASTTLSGSSEPILIGYEFSSPSCANGTDAWIDVTVSGGSGSYTYSWSNGSTTEDLAGIAPGYYTTTVTDSKGCTSTARISIPNTPAIGIATNEITQPDCLGNLGSITVSAFNGTAPYTYSWTHGATGESLTGLAPGYYTLIVTDANGCKSSRTFQIKEPSKPQVQISGGSCGDSTLTAIVSGGQGPYSYEWSTGATTTSISSTSGEYYTVTVTDQMGCTAEADIEVNEIGSTIDLSTTTTNPDCYGSSTGSIDLSVSGGTGNYTIIWSNDATTEDLSNIGAGTYTVTVTDESGCIKTATVNLNSPAAITIVATETINANCDGLGSITVDAQNGIAPYTYTWTHGATGSSLDNLQPGQYTVTATDAKGCQSNKSFTIGEEQAPIASIINTGTCSSQQLSAKVSGNTGPYTYQWSTGATTASIIPNVNGSYSLIVTDANGCTATAYTEVTLGESSLSLAAEVQAASCFGSADGSASILISGGTAPYTYDWSNGLKVASANNLTAGVYSVRVTDARGCYDVVAFQIKQSAPITISLLGGAPSTCGQPNGSLTITVEGGTAPYTYKWNNGATTSTLTGVVADIYTVAVIDAIGCSAEASFAVQASAISSFYTSAWIEECEDTMIAAGSAANILVNFKGLAPYTFTYSDGSTEHTVTTMANPYTLTVQPRTTTTYTLTGVFGSCGQQGSAFGEVTVNVVSPKTPVCTDGCFSTNLISTVNGSNCTTYTLQINSGSNCRYDLSHFQVAVPCGNVSSMNNSRGWAMSVGLDPTTGVQGIKVDNIKGFNENESFTITYTLCNTVNCSDTPATCGPLVAYKAGQCVYFDKASPLAPVSDTPSYDGVLGPGMSLHLYPNPIMANQLLTLEIENLFVTTTANITISSLTGLKVYEQNRDISPSENKVQLYVPNLATGTYVVSVMFNNNRYTKQLFIY